MAGLIDLSRAGGLAAALRAAPRAKLRKVWQVAGIDDEAADPDPWPCWCGQVFGCAHSLDVRLKGMLCRLTEKQALRFLELAGVHERQTPRRRVKLLGKFVPKRMVRGKGVGRRKRSENPVLAWFFCLAFDMAPERCEDFLYWLKFAAIVYLERLFRRPPAAGRSWYLPWAAQQVLLSRLPEYVEPAAGSAVTAVCPGPAKVSVLAGRRGEGEANDSGEARANGLLGVALFHPGDIRVEQLPTKFSRRGKHLRNGHTVAGRVGMEAAVRDDYAVGAAAAAGGAA